MSTSLVLQLQDKIQNAKTAAECHKIQRELTEISQLVNTKLKELDTIEKEATASEKKKANSHEDEIPFTYDGEDAEFCPCGNTMHPNPYLEQFDECTKCNNIFCVECLRDCDECGKAVCMGEIDKFCAVFCGGCDDMVLCGSPACFQYCEICDTTPMCLDCKGTQLLPPFRQKVCPDCFDSRRRY